MYYLLLAYVIRKNIPNIINPIIIILSPNNIPFVVFLFFIDDFILINKEYKNGMKKY